jgi:hypothetical protein
MDLEDLMVLREKEELKAKLATEVRQECKEMLAHKEPEDRQVLPAFKDLEGK